MIVWCVGIGVRKIGSEVEAFGADKFARGGGKEGDDRLVGRNYVDGSRVVRGDVEGGNWECRGI